MVISCSAIGCSNHWNKNRPEIRFHRYPFSRPNILENWITATGRENWKPTKYSFLCSKHFRKESYETPLHLGRIYLKRDAVPEIFNYSAGHLKVTKKLRSLSHIVGLPTTATQEMSSSKTIQTKNSRKKKPKPILEELRTKNYVTNESEEIISAAMVPEQQNEHISIHGSTDDDDIMMEEDNETEEKLEEIPLCRLCASRSEDAISLFENKPLGCVLLEKIHTYLPIMITVEDLLPTTVCGKCIKRLEICHSLVQDCLDADITLKTMFDLQNSNQMQNNSKNAASKHSDSSRHTKDAHNNSLQKSKQFNDFMNLTDIKFEVESKDDVEAETSKQNAVQSNDIVEAEMSNQGAIVSNDIVEVEISNQNAVESNDIVEAETSSQIAVGKNNDAIQSSNKVSLDTRMTEESDIQIVNTELKLVNKSSKRKRKPKLKFLVVKKKADNNVSEEAEIQKLLEFALKKMNPKKPKTQMPREKHKPQEMPSVDNCSVANHKEISRVKDTDQNVGHIHEERSRDHTYTCLEQEESVDREKT